MKDLLTLIGNKQFARARAMLQDMNEVDVAECLNEIEDPKQLLLVFRLLPKEMAAEVFAYLDHDLQEKVVTDMTDRELSGILDELYLDDTVDFLDELPSSLVKRVLAAANPETRKQINQLLMYPEDSAGSLMTTEFMEIRKDWNVSEALKAIRRQSEDKESIAYLFVTDAQRHLQGMISLRDVLCASDDAMIGDMMDSGVISAGTHEDQAEVAEKFKKYDLVSMPVVDTENRLVGIITVDDMIDVMDEETTEDMYKMAAMAPIDETYLNVKVTTLARKRVVWLLVLMISATFTGMIIQNFNDALSANVMLASFIPMLMDTSGNAGSQSSVSVIRSLVLGEVQLKDAAAVIWKEFRVSLLVGATVSAVNFIRVVIMYKDIMLATVVSITLVCAIIAAKFVGCTLPMLATKLKLDPALMASPMITTIVDAVSLLVYFNVAIAIMPGL